MRLTHAARAPLDSLPVRMRRVGHGKRDILHAVALGRGPPTDLAVAAQPARQDEADVALLDERRRRGRERRSGSGVCGAREPEGVLVEERRRLRVPDPDLEACPAVDRHEVVVAHVANSRRPGERCPTPDDENPERDQHAARDLEPGKGLRQENDDKHGRDEGLQVCRQRRPVGTDPVD